MANFSIRAKMSRDFKVIPGYHLYGVVPKCFDDSHTMFEMLGRSTEWFIIENVIFILWFFTMVSYMIKSRFRFVGINPKDKFENFWLTLMWNELERDIALDVSGYTSSKKKQAD